MKRFEIFLKRLANFGLSFTLQMYFVKRVYGDESYIRFLLSKLHCLFSDEIEAGKQEPVVFKKEKGKPFVWTMWWQGENALPEILKVCYKSHLKYIDQSKYKYTMITKDNYTDYIIIPDYIEEKLKKGIISFTHFSDLLRIMLVRKYGGAWIDITLLLTSQLNPLIFNYCFYSFNQKDSDYLPVGFGQTITKCNWAGFFLCAPPDSNLFCFVEKCLLKYWKDYDYTLDYFLLNLIIRLGYNEIDQIARAVKCVPLNNKKLYCLQPLMNKCYSEEVFRSICKDTHFFKLTQKVNYVEYSKNKTTFYNYLKNQYL